MALDPIGDAAPDGLPARCDAITGFVHRDTISFYAADHPERTGESAR